MKKLYYITFFAAFVIIMSMAAFNSSEPATKESLGEMLFSDPILSGNRKISCSSCHKAEFAFADTIAISPGVSGRTGTRNAPSVMNSALQASFFWDGRASTLEQQALLPVANPVEMNLPIALAIKRLNRDKKYRKAFYRVFNQYPNATNLALALAAFERTLETSNSPFDDWRLTDNENAVSTSVKRGFLLFNGKARCFQCHFGPDFNNSEFRNIGLFDGKLLTDSGRVVLTKKKTDLGKFKIGPLRNIALTAPYMHNGRFKTLREVIDYYNDPDKIVPHSIGRDPLLSTPINLSVQEKEDIEEFLKSLTDKRFIKDLSS